MIDTGNAPPIYTPPYRCSKAEEEVIQREVDDMLQQGVIRPSKSAWGSSPVLVVKKTGDWRLCIDYRPLNRVTKKEAYPMPLVDNMLNSVGQSSWFCLIDLKSAYWQIPMEESPICKTAFSTQKGHYEFTRIPFGLSFAAFTFQTRADEVLREVVHICKAYLDALLCHGRTFEECCQRPHQVLKILVEAKSQLLASFSKCQFLMQEMPYLGFLLTGDRVKIDPSKTEAVRNLKAPTDVPGLQHVLGLFSITHVSTHSSLEWRRP